MILLLWILWILLGILIFYITYLWYDEKNDNFVMIDSGAVFLGYLFTCATAGLGWPIMWVCAIAANNKFNINKPKNPIRKLIKEIQNPRENV